MKCRWGGFTGYLNFHYRWAPFPESKTGRRQFLGADYHELSPITAHSN